MEIIINDNLLNRIGNEFIEKIIENTQKGMDEKGKPFKSYSINPLAIPAGAFFSDGWKTSNKKLLNAKEAFFINKGGKSWVVIAGGYAKMKSNRFPQDGGKVNLHVTGNMLNSLSIIGRGQNTITIGFTNPESMQKALYHNILGAGKSKVKRQFMGLPKSHINAIIKSISDELTSEVAQTMRKNFRAS